MKKLMMAGLLVAFTAGSALMMGCSDDDDGGGGAGGGTAGSGGGTAGSGGGTAGTGGEGGEGGEGGSTVECSSAFGCINGACTCSEGPNEGKSCCDPDECGEDDPTNCSTFCEVCK